MRKKLEIFIIVAILLIVFSNSVFGYTQNVNVSVPSFNIRLNGVFINNENREYPFILYKGITYFPMTYYDSRFMGSETKWDETDGLKIIKSEKFNGYFEVNSKLNKSNFTATVPNFPVEVNGKKIDNTKEQYPILLFRNITYFPLTWRFAAEEFGWDYKYTMENGLAINNPSNYEINISKVNLPVIVRDDLFDKNKFTVAGDYFYYEGKNGIIYQAPIEKPNERKAIYELPLWTYGDSYVYADLKTVNNKAVLSYHQGGAVMGTDYEIILHEDGTNEIFSEGYVTLKEFGDLTVKASNYLPPSSNNLSIKFRDESEFRSIGNPDYIYGWTWHYSESGSGGGQNDDLFMVGDELYLLAYYKPREKQGTTGIHKVNIKTGETVRVCEESARHFIIYENNIYFMDDDGYLYKLPLYEKEAKRLTDFPINNFTVLGNEVYYITNEDKGYELFRLGDKTSLNSGGSVKRIINKEGYISFIFDTKNSSADKMMVINLDGDIVYKTNANVIFSDINDNSVYYIVGTDK